MTEVPAAIIAMSFTTGDGLMIFAEVTHTVKGQYLDGAMNLSFLRI